MAKFYGDVGYGVNQETAPGVWQDVLVEKSYYGDVLNNGRRLVQAPRRVSPTGEVNDDIDASNRISIVTDPYAQEHFYNIRYLKWVGVRWLVSNVEVAFPRLILTLGGVYNGPTPATPDSTRDFDGEPR